MAASGLAVTAPALVTASTGSPAAAGAAQAATIAPVKARTADSLADAYGICVHMAYGDTPYANAGKVTSLLKNLGVRHVRDDMFMNNPFEYDGIRTVAASGIKFNMIMGKPTSPDSPAKFVATLARELPGAVESLEGTNEWDLTGRGNWVNEVRSWQQQLWNAAKANPATKNLPVLAPSMAFPSNQPKVGSFSTTADFANGHLYPGGRTPSLNLATNLPMLSSYVGNRPVITTEDGYHNATGSRVTNANGHPAVPEAVAADYLPRMLLEHFQRGAKRVYSYELLDEFVDDGKTNQEANFGIVRRDYTPKPAYTAMKNLLGLVSDPGASFTPGSLAYQVNGAGSDLRQVLVQKRDGRFVLLLWRDVSLYDTSSFSRINAGSDAVTVALAGPADVKVFDPGKQSGAISSRSGATSVPLNLDGGVTALEIDPSTVDPGTTTPVGSTPVTNPDANPAPAESPYPMPVGLQATTGRSSMALKWRPGPGSTALHGFLITRVQDSKQVIVPAGTRSYTWWGLYTGKKYSFAVQAFRIGSISDPAFTPVMVPGSRPSTTTSLQVTSLSAARTTKAGRQRARRGVQVRWARVDGRGSRVTRYQVIVGGRRVSVPATRTAVTVRNLRHKRVRVGLRARNAMGWSATRWSRPVRTR